MNDDRLATALAHDFGFGPSMAADLAKAARAHIGDEIQQEADEALRVAELFADHGEISPHAHGQVMGLRTGVAIARNGRQS